MKTSDEQLYAMRHSAAHVMAAAVTHLFENVKLGVGPVIKNGFYYDIDLGDKKISEEDFPRIEKEMRAIIKQDQPFVLSEQSVDEAVKWANESAQPYKLELLNDLKRAGTTSVRDLDVTQLGIPTDDEGVVDSVTFYQNGDFTDLCRGPHVESTGKIGAFKIMKVAGAYWRGKEVNPQMQRLYGVAFATQEDLDKYLAQTEEAKNRDHRKLGRELDLFTFSDLVGPGLPLFTPRGTILRNLIKQALMQSGVKFGAEEVSIPHIARRELYEISGHAKKFAEELFEVSSHYDIDFVMKPVNCPHHTQIYASKIRSYRDLPISYMESTMQYRDEKPGQIGGLTRVRAITVDDGHVFCTTEQIYDEAIKLCKFIVEFHTSLGMYGDHWVSLSVRDPKTPDKYIGEQADWDKAESMLEKVCSDAGLQATRVEGEAALYGPKIDFMYEDVSGNERQLATIQLDFATPKRFELKYVDSDGSDNCPVMIHRAILGSYERFMAILLEKTAGWLPFWLAPEQIRILTINDTVLDYVQEVQAVLESTVLMEPVKYNELRVQVDDRNESLGRKIRDAAELKVPLQIIVGPKDRLSRQVSVRHRDGESKVNLDDLRQFIQQVK